MGFPKVHPQEVGPISCPTWGPVPAPPPGQTWEGLMRMALAEGRRAAQCGEIPVGAVVVAADGVLLSAAHNRTIQHRDPTAHAEILALQAAGAACGNYRLNGCVLVVTLEPCLMCAGAMVHARLSGLVYGAADSRAGAVESCLNALDLPFLNHRVWHMGGVASADCTALLHDFFANARHALPAGMGQP